MGASDDNFVSVKTVLSRRFFVPMLRDVMGKVEELSVRSDSPSVRLSCRQASRGGKGGRDVFN